MVTTLTTHPHMRIMRAWVECMPMQRKLLCYTCIAFHDPSRCSSSCELRQGIALLINDGRLSRYLYVHAGNK